MEYTTMPQVLERLGKRFIPLAEEAATDIAVLQQQKQQ
jgi:hypothetical protein